MYKKKVNNFTTSVNQAQANNAYFYRPRGSVSSQSTTNLLSQTSQTFSSTQEETAVQPPVRDRPKRRVIPVMPTTSVQPTMPIQSTISVQPIIPVQPTIAVQPSIVNVASLKVSSTSLNNIPKNSINTLQQIQLKSGFHEIPVIPVKKIKVKIETINSVTHQVQFNENATGLTIKNYIYENLCQSLQTNQICLKYQGTKIGNYRKLSEIQIVVGTKLKIVQEKADLNQVSNVIADLNGVDGISGQVGVTVTKMCCGHNIGRDTMTAFVRSLISADLYEIRCPFLDQNENVCNTAWNFKDCKTVGVFKKEEIQQFEKGLSQNWIKKFAKQCPKCKATICKGDLKTNRVICPHCKYGDFCFFCLGKWTGGKVCGNEECTFLATFIENAEMNCKFELFNKIKNKKIEYITPQYRACPHCSCIIEHREACKHMQCKSCSRSFCWVCLSVKDQQGNWPCGKYNEYCGKVAQKQKVGVNI